MVLTRTSFPVLRLLPVLALAIALGGATGAVARESDARSGEVAAAVTDIARLLEVGETSDVYDRVHPDVRNQVPRRAFVSWVTGSDIPADPVVRQVTSMAWTSPLTGITYPQAALVDISWNAVRDGVTIEESETWVFVHDGERWRWFPDITAASIASLLAIEEDTPGAYLPSFRQAAYIRLDRFWQGEFFAAGRQYIPLEIRPVTADAVDTGCGTIPDVRQIAIFYCVYDATVYFDPAFRDDVTGQVGGYGWTMVIAHEWGHHIQAQLGIDIAAPAQEEGLSPLELELQADCLAAIATQDALARGDIGQDEVEAAIAIITLGGDASGTNPDGPGAHGTAAERVAAFEAGFESGFIGCGVDLDPPA